MKSEALAVTYVIGTYPLLTTTFIDREIECLLRRGSDVAILAVRRPPGLLSPSQQLLESRVRYLLPAPWLGVGRAHLRMIVRRPRAYATALWKLLTARHDHGSRLRTIGHFGAGVYAASLAEDRRGIRLHAHFVDRATTVAMVAARLLDSPYSCTAHANDIYVNPVLLREKIQGSTFTATCTEENRRYLIRRVGALEGARIHTIAHGLDLTAFRERGSAPNQPSGPILLTVAQLKEKKGLHDLVLACRILADRGITFRCRIIGDGPLRSELTEAILRAGLQEWVTLVGALPFDRVIEEYASATIFVLPSVIASDGDRDGIPNVILEAMAMRLPVVSTTVSGIPEAVVHDETGRLVPPGQPVSLATAIEGLLSDPAKQLRLGAAGRRRVEERFDIDRNVDVLVSAFLMTAA